MSKQTFNRVALMGRSGVPGVPETLTALTTYLLSLDIHTVVEESSAALIEEHQLQVIAPDQLYEHADLLIVVGGDGSLLNAAHIAITQNLPVLGINRGRLGFLTDIHPIELHKVKEVLQGCYQLEKRFLLHTSIHYHKHHKKLAAALNDVVLLPGDVAHMIEFDIYVDEQFVCSQRADGMIIATPTGSTAYALSGGGPILHPQLDAIVLVPMFPHTLSSRPIVVNSSSAIKFVIAKDNAVTPYVSCDGQTRIATPPGAKIYVEKKGPELQLIHPNDYTYFKTLREKLNWEKRATRNQHMD